MAKAAGSAWTRMLRVFAGPSAEDPVLRLGRGEVAEVVEALDRLGLALAVHGHRWTPAERGGYERAMEVLGRGGPG